MFVCLLLADVLFFDTDPPRTEDDRKERMEDALKQLKEYIPSMNIVVIL